MASVFLLVFLEGHQTRGTGDIQNNMRRSLSARKGIPAVAPLYLRAPDHQLAPIWAETPKLSAVE